MDASCQLRLYRQVLCMSQPGDGGDAVASGHLSLPANHFIWLR